MKKRQLRLESLEDRCLLAVVAGGEETAAGLAAETASDGPVEACIAITTTVPTAALVDEVATLHQVNEGDTIYVSVYVKSTDSKYGIQGGYCSLYYDTDGFTPGDYTASPIFPEQTLNDDHNYSADNYISIFGGFPSSPSYVYGQTQWALVGTQSFMADMQGEYQFSTGTARNGKGVESDFLGFTREDFGSSREYGNPVATLSLTVGDGSLPVPGPANHQMGFVLVVTDALPVDAEVANPTVSVGDGINLISETEFGETVYVSLYVRSTDPEYGVQYGYCSLRYDEAGLTPDTYYAGPNFDSLTINDGFDFISVGCISAFGGEPSNPSASFGKTGWALVGTMSFTADVVGQYEFTTGMAVNAKGEERESWGFVREDFEDTYEYSTPDVSASLAITGEMPVIEDVTVEGWTGGYDGYAHSITVTDSSAETDKILYSTDGVNYNLTDCPEYTEDGIYTTYVRVSRRGYANWYGSADVEIQHVAPVVTTLDDIVDSGDHQMSLREAIARAIEGDVITFDSSLAGGTITLNGTQIEISKGISIDASDIGGITIDANRQSRVFKTSGGTVENPIGFINLIIKGGSTGGGGAGIYNIDSILTITKCNITSNKTINSDGGGIYNENGLLTVTDSIFSKNSVTKDASGVVYIYGGAIYNYRGDTSVSNSTFSGNSSTFQGGAIYNYVGTVSTIDSSFSENTAMRGGAIDNPNGTVMLINSTLSSNLVSINGGAIYNYGTLILENAALFDNSTLSGVVSGSGGAIYNGGTVTATNSSFSGNLTDGNGGGICNFGTLTITNSIFTENSAKLDGGAIYNNNDYYEMFTVNNSIFSKNTACSGAGIYNNGGMLSMINSIIAKNISDSDWPDIYNEYGTIKAINTLSSFTDWTEATNCLVYDPAQPLFEDAENGDYTLAKYSQAVNKGDNTYVETETDLAGNQRIVNGIVDLGAYERQELAPSVMLTGTKNYYVSYGANRHRLDWEAVTDALAYELAYSTDGLNWTRIKTRETFAIVSGLTYGDEVSYRVRALGEGVFIDSDWSDVKTFAVCPMDINNDRAIAGADRRLMATAWLAEEFDDNYQYCADINADGDISNTDRAFLISNWLREVGEDELTYPAAKAADAVFAEYEPAGLDVDLNVF